MAFGTEQALLLAALRAAGGRGARPALCRCRRWRRSISIRSAAGASRQVAVDIEPRSGPVIVTIEYLIAQEDVVAFLSAMAERRRIRRRDGARHWTLLRDLTNPELWIERYDSPTWVEYVRQNQRVTQADAEIGERVRALHKGPNPPGRPPHDRARRSARCRASRPPQRRPERRQGAG